MNKGKSALILTVLTIIIAALCLTCVISFPLNGVEEYNSVISMIGKSADFDFAGGYYYVYYPEGVISAQEYDTNYAAYGSDAVAQQKYRDKYVAYENGALYLEKEVVLDEETGKVGEEFKTAFANSVELLRARYDEKGISGTRLSVADDYTVRVTLPYGTKSANNTIPVFGIFGEFSVAYGSETSKIIENNRDASIGDYVKGVSSRTTQDGTSYVIIDFTSAGREALKTATAGAASSSSTMYFMLGDQSLISLSVSSQIDQDSLYISGSYTDDTARTVAIALNSGIKADQTIPYANLCDLKSTVTIETVEAPFGDFAFAATLITLGVLALVLSAFMFVRYHGLGFAHLYGLLALLGCMAVSIFFVPFIYYGVGTVVVLALAMIVYTALNVYMFENAKKEYASGKTMKTAAYNGYMKSLWPTVDLSAAVALASVLTFAIALTELQAVAFTAMLAAVIVGASVLLVSKLTWMVTVIFAKNPASFCNFKREEVDDDE